VRPGHDIDTDRVVDAEEAGLGHNEETSPEQGGGER
jgi:hypothetical protein